MPSTLILSRSASLAELRRAEAGLVAELKAKREAFDLEHAPLVAALKDAQALAAAEESTLRELAINEYQMTGDAKVSPGVDIKLFEQVRYDAAQAYEWAKAANLALIPQQLDRKAFEKIAKATKIHFVTYEKEARVTIATDLDKALSGVDLAPAPAGV